MRIENLQSILKRYWGYDSFRGIQREIIESIFAGRDTLGLMPTGGGKSITFQVPALAQEGVCVVITPLIALMKDQVHNLRRRGIKAAAIYSGMSHDDIVQTLENAVFGGVKLLYVSPERLSSDIFRTKLRHMQVSFICVDEAHCISQWGYDFRPSYLEIAHIRQDLPDIPILALTATATPQVVDDIQDRLAFRQKNVFRMSFERKNLSYVVRYAPDKQQQLVHILNNVAGSAIVYARSRQRTKEYAQFLTAKGFSATFFHAGLADAEKDQRQRDWQADKVRVMVATNAFGMGIDKPDVRLVIHVDCPSSIEAYFQEAGRAGRDGQRAYAVLLYNNSDQQKLQKRIADTFPAKDFIRQVYDHLAYFYQVGVGSGYNAIFEFPIDKFCHAYKHFPIQVDSALKILDRAGYIEYREEEESQARLMFTIERDDLYRLKGNSPEEDKIIVTLLRHYSGLFCDYAYIDEAFIAQQTQLSQPVVYQSLKLLSQKHILNFIPQKRTPYVRYRQRREDAEHLTFPPAVYEDLRRRFAERIEAMLRYATTSDQCRSRQLLRYFGESSSTDCGHCDVCLDRKGSLVSREKLEEAQTMILDLLNDRQEHRITQLHALPLPYETMDEALRRLVDERTIIDDDGWLRLG
ncbi:MAG: RecQ family ATP-dependent DNA helicase [Prevotella sp.]|nr:RecQ family ATP-dependent DNA helicase [Prevotella sp.]